MEAETDQSTLDLQAAKALAMGPRHDDSLLSETVLEPYLSTVRKDAASARKAGWFWSYRLSDLYVTSHPFFDLPPS